MSAGNGSNLVEVRVEAKVPSKKTLCESLIACSPLEENNMRFVGMAMVRYSERLKPVAPTPSPAGPLVEKEIRLPFLSKVLEAELNPGLIKKRPCGA